MIQAWLGTYASRHPDTEVLANATVILDAENTVQPDALLRRLPDHGGLTRVNEDGYLTGPPEPIVEVASSSAAIDMRDKRRACCRNRVQEYLVWLVAEGRLEWFHQRQTECRNGVIRAQFSKQPRQRATVQNLPVASPASRFHVAYATWNRDAGDWTFWLGKSSRRQGGP